MLNKKTTQNKLPSMKKSILVYLLTGSWLWGMEAQYTCTPLIGIFNATQQSLLIRIREGQTSNQAHLLLLEEVGPYRWSTPLATTFTMLRIRVWPSGANPEHDPSLPVITRTHGMASGILLASDTLKTRFLDLDDNSLRIVAVPLIIKNSIDSSLHLVNKSDHYETAQALFQHYHYMKQQRYNDPEQ
jgi:hypothetical protein